MVAPSVSYTHLRAHETKESSAASDVYKRQEEARVAVLQVIQMAKDENQNVIKIVHGKGPEAILKTYVNGWLRQHRDVLAFVSAPEKQGGTGAVLVLLKRAEKNPKFKQ